MKLPKIILILLSVAIAVIVVSLRNIARRESDMSVGSVPAVQRSEAPSVSDGKPSRPSSEKSPPDSILEKFGRNLEVAYDSSGRLSAIQGKLGQGEPARGPFKPSDHRLAIARANEILAVAKPLLGIEARSPLGVPVAKVGEVTAHVYYKQTFEGAEVYQYGNVTIDLGPQGELLSLHSDYVPELSAANQRTLSAAELTPQGKEVIGGTPVFFVPAPATPSEKPGRHAYEYTVDDRQVVIDASTREVLLRRDKRKL